MALRWSPALLALWGCAACASAGVTLTANLAPERSLELTLRNASAQSIGYNLCTSALERRNGDAWTAVKSRRICTMELRTLEPGSEARYSFSIADLPSGEYRARARIEGVTTQVLSEPFHVDGLMR